MPPANILRPKCAEYSAHSKLLLYLCPLRLAGRLCLCFGTRLGFRLRGTGRCNRRGRTRFHGPVLARQKNLRATSNNWVCSGYELKYVSLTSLCLKLFFPRVFWTLQQAVHRHIQLGALDETVLDRFPLWPSKWQSSWLYDLCFSPN